MKLVLFLAILPLVTAQCRTRPEWSQMSETDKQTFLSAIKTLKSRTLAGRNAPPTTISYDDIVAIHWDFVNVAHSVPMFLVWHRNYVWMFEEALRTINPNIVVPYWDTSFESQKPHLSQVFSPKYFGGNGKGTNKCITDGVFADWPVTVPKERGGPSCIQRCFDGGSTIQPFWPPEVVDNLLKTSKNYDSFRTQYEAGPHGRVHVGIGNDCGDMSTMHSVNDPIFWLHHANVDRVYSRWQDLCPSYATSYGGSNRGGSAASTLDKMTPFPSVVRDFLNASSSNYCVKYTRAPSDTDISIPGCTSKPTSTSTSSVATSVTTATSSVSSAVATSSSNASPAVTGWRAVDLSKNNLKDDWLIRAFRSFNDSKISILAKRDDLQVSGWNESLPKYSRPANMVISAPLWDDDSDTEHLRYFPYLPEKYVDMMQLNREHVRSCENNAMRIIDQLNNQKGYISKASLKMVQEYFSKSR